MASLAFISSPAIPTDAATYVFEEPGDYVLPAIELAWIDSASGKRQAARVPEIKLSVAANPSFKRAIAPDAQESSSSARRRLAWLRGLSVALAALATVAVALWLARRYGPRYRAWRAARRHMRAESESAYSIEWPLPAAATTRQKRTTR